MFALRAEFKKLLTVRSTYFWIGAIFIMMLFLGFWVEGYKDVELAATNPFALQLTINHAVFIVGLFLSFIAILLVGHEYRYNTIMYTLSASNSRTKIFLAKITAVLILAIIVSIATLSFCIAAFYVGHSLHHISPLAQHIAIRTTLWHFALYIAGGIAYAYIATIIFRNLIAAFVFVLVVPSTVEQLLSLLLKGNTKYLPYTALSNLTEVKTSVSYTTSALVVATYIVLFGLISYFMFMKRDAN